MTTRLGPNAPGKTSESGTNPQNGIPISLESSTNKVYLSQNHTWNEVNMSPRKLIHNAYTVAWLCVLDCELIAARALLDEEDEPLDPALHDDNLYILGRIL